MNQFLQDIRYALRQLRKSPGFTLTAVITLALGIGANTAIFTLVQGILLRSLPFADSAQLYRLGDNDDCCVEGGFPGGASDTGDFTIFSNNLYQHLREHTPEFEQLAAMQAGIWTWNVRRGNAAAKPLRGEFISGNYFTTLGLGAYIGRAFSDKDDTPASSPVTVLSYRAWQGEFASDTAIIGSTVYIQTKPFTVVGVAPPGFFGDRVTDNPPDFWVPLNAEPLIRGTESSILHQGDSHWLYLIGRVRQGTNIGVLQSKLKVTLQQWLYTRQGATANGGESLVPKMYIALTPGGGGIQNLQQQTGKGLKMLMILSSVVLLIACANIANLLLARSTARRSDISLRMALGAGRRRLMIQVLTESTLLSCIGGLAGLVVAYLGVHTILAAAFPDARNLPISADPSLAVLGFAFLVSLATGVLFGTAPAWATSNAQPAEALRGANRSTRDRSSLPQKTLVVLQAAMSLVLLGGAILMTRTLVKLEHQNFGVATDNRYVLHVDPSGAGYTIDRLPGLYRQIETRFSALPGITAVGMGLYSPLEGNNWGECAIPQGHAAPRPGDRCGASWDRVSPQFLDAVGVSIVRGRNFSEQDTAASPQVVLVNQTFAKHFFPHEDPIGKRFGIDDVKYSGAWEIVGVFADFKLNNPRDEVRPVYLRPLAQKFLGYKEAEMNTGETQSMFIGSIVLRFNSPQADADALIRQTLASIDPNLTVEDLRTMNSQVADNFNQERLIAQLSTLFGALSLILASIGLYGVMSYFVARRTSEIGIRMALGATRGSVVGMIMRGAMGQVIVGLCLGIPTMLYAGYLMKSLLYGVGSYDGWAIVGGPLMLLICAALAGYIPARRAASIDPMQALRSE